MTPESVTCDGPLLGLATTRQLLEELAARGRHEPHYEALGTDMCNGATSMLAALPGSMLDYRTAGPGADDRPSEETQASAWTDSTADMIEFAHGLIAGAANIGDPPVEHVPGWNAAAREWTERYHRWLTKHLKETCRSCRKPFIAWAVPAGLWDDVMGGDPEHALVCLPCFAIKAETRGVTAAWRVVADRVDLCLQIGGGQSVTGSQVGGGITQVSHVDGDVTL